MTLSSVFRSVLSSAAWRSDIAHVQGVAERALRCCEVYRKSFPMTEIAFPADVLGDRMLAKWVRDHRFTVEVRTGEDVAVAVAAGVHPTQMLVQAGGLGESDLRATVNLAPGQIVVSSLRQIDLLASAVEHHTQGVFLRVIDSNAPMVAVAGNEYAFRDGFRLDSTELDRVVGSVLGFSRLDLTGLYCEVGAREHDFVSYPAAIGQLITEMSHIRRQHGVVITRLGLGGARAVPSGDWTAALPQLANEIDESLDDACATMRFPRSMIVLTPGRAIVGQDAA